eukprot:13381269-Alexandrium_andersonii.AAC.1
MPPRRAREAPPHANIRIKAGASWPAIRSASIHAAAAVKAASRRAASIAAKEATVATSTFRSAETAPRRNHR